MTTVSIEPHAFQRITDHLRGHQTEQVVFLFLYLFTVLNPQ